MGAGRQILRRGATRAPNLGVVVPRRFVSPKRMLAALAVVVLVAPLSAPTGIAAPVQAAVVEAGSVLDSSGLRIVDAITQARPTNEAQA